MLTGGAARRGKGRCGHHAKVTPDPAAAERRCEEAAPPPSPPPPSSTTTAAAAALAVATQYEASSDSGRNWERDNREEEEEEKQVKEEEKRRHDAASLRTVCFTAGVKDDERQQFWISASGRARAGSPRRQSGFMSVQSNSGSGGGSLEATPSWSQLSSSPTISQHITAAAKSKEGISDRQLAALATPVLVKPPFIARVRAEAGWSYSERERESERGGEGERDLERNGCQVH